jgi:hypothetical protein
MSLVVEHRLAHAACNLGCGIVSSYLTSSVLQLLLNVLKTKAFDLGLLLSCAVALPH